MPFGIQTKGLVVGVVLGALVIPRVVHMAANRGNK